MSVVLVHPGSKAVDAGCGTIDVDDVARLIAEMREAGYAPWTIRGVLTPLSRLFSYAERRGLIAANPVGRLERGERPKVERKNKRILSGEEISSCSKPRPRPATCSCSRPRTTRAFDGQSCSA